MSWRGTTTVTERIFAALPYLLPLADGIGFGTFLFKQFPILGVIFLPILPVINLYNSIPFAGLIVFFALYLLVVRNESINHFIRFNTMQAILIDIILVLCSFIVPILVKGVPVQFVIEVLFNMIFLGLLASVIYSVVQSFRGLYPEIPTLSDAVHMQVR
ncbi:MAG TPA: Tic20 family protein [Halomicronema sp.]